MTCQRPRRAISGVFTNSDLRVYWPEWIPGLAKWNRIPFKREDWRKLIILGDQKSLSAKLGVSESSFRLSPVDGAFSPEEAKLSRSCELEFVHDLKPPCIEPVLPAVNKLG
jgi:hypothetical protein